MKFVWSIEAQKNLESLDAPIQKRIAEKMRWFQTQSDPLSFTEPLTGIRDIFRFRIGAYRIFVHPDGVVLTVLRIRKRSEAYR